MRAAGVGRSAAARAGDVAAAARLARAPRACRGRKSKSHRLNGHKRHIAADVDTRLILAAAITRANLPEAEATGALGQDIERQDLSMGAHRARVRARRR